MQPTHLAHDFVAGPQMQMVGVAEYHRGAHLDEIVGIERFDRGERSHRHERRRIDRAVWRGKNAGPSGAVGRSDLEGKAHRL